MAGVDVHYHSVVGDNLDRMVWVLKNALSRSDVVIVTGGLGPTPDDITREGIAAATGRSLVRRPELEQKIKEVFERLGRAMPEENLRQADLPHEAVPIAAEGTAPGFWIEKNSRLIFALPGVPWEMETMLYQTVVPKLKERASGDTILSREIIVVGLGESRTHELIRTVVESQSNPTIAYRASAGQVRVRLTAKAASEAEAIGLIEPIEEEIRDRLGDDAIAGHFESLADALGDALRRGGATLAAAESLTGGLIAAELTKTGGAGDYFLGSLVVYDTAAKRDVAGVDPGILQGPGAVSEEAAVALAEAAAHKFSADLGIAATGVAGPSEQEGKPVGTIFVAAIFGGRKEVRHVRGYGTREHIRQIGVTAALDLGRRLFARNS
jgi:nicotinamide-nucleotide amidase